MAKRKRSKNKTRLWLYILVVFIVIGITGFIYFLLYSDFLKVDRMELNQSIFYERSDFINDLGTNIISYNNWLGILNKNNILFWYFAPNVIESPKDLPFASRIDIKVNLPLKTVAINTVENNFKGIICKDESSCYAFNKEGILYSQAPYVEGFLLMKIQDQSNRPLVLGEYFLPQEQWINRIFETVDILKDNSVYFRHIFIEDLDLREWGITLASGVDMYFSFEFVPEDLGEVVTNFLSKTNKEGLDYVDFRIPGRIYYK